MIKGPSLEREKALELIYNNNRNTVIHFIINNNGNEDEAKDIYQETILSFYENVLMNKFNATSSITTYIFSIARFKWLNKIKKNKTIENHEANAYADIEKEKSQLAVLIDKEKKELVLNVLDKLGLKCKELLIDSIYHDYSMKEIAGKGDYSSEQLVRNQKYKCLKKLKNLIQAKPEIVKLIRWYE